MSGGSPCTAALSSTLVLSATLLLANFPELDCEKHRKKIITNSFLISHPLREILNFSRLLFEWPNFKEEILPPLLNVCQSYLMKKLTETDFEEIVLVLTQVVLNFSKSSDMSYGLDLVSQQGLLFLPKCASKQGKVMMEHFVDALKSEKDEKFDDHSLTLVWGVLVCLPCIR